MQTYKLDGHTFTAEDCIDGVLINPALPDEFDETPHDDRSNSELRLWWGRAYIVISKWPGGTRYETRCLDGGTSDGPTNWGAFATLELAVQCAKSGSRHHRS
ncbi:hypothetical protein EVC45_08330 [Paraburkholderia sp. UYCP14C]|uniref:hypothetical protein n=1 Tax=Paraburkholderia sp. UYCP14C TaxID=2511130 RepID=UPI0010200698|nr:hypothetical protein [Paraburkholderia sp. UYCP14C]RZF30472.1 hypothetical protein EVC45_08330 [Paraburkholderia sp. UYCP14C]